MKKILIVSFILLSVQAFAQQRPAPNPSLDSLKNEKDTIALNRKIEVLKNGSQKDLSLLLSFYNSSRNMKKAEEVVEIALQRYPHGTLAAIKAANAIYAESDAVKQEKMNLAYKKNFPAEKTDMIDYAVALSYATVKNTAKATEYLSYITDAGFRPSAVTQVTKVLMNYDVVTAERIVKTELENVKRLMADTTLVGDRRNDLLFKPKQIYYNMALLYSSILIKKEDYKAALVYTKEVFDQSPVKSDALNQSYYYLLSKNGNYREALPELQKIAASGQADEATKAELMRAYTKLNPGKNVNAYMASFVSALDKKSMEEAEKMIVKEQSPDFTVTDINGRHVSLADFKGKTIILDFWATWCGPCKASFPAMQRLVNKYKSDPNVKFLFIHTWESSATPQQDAVNYLKTNNYQMDLYMDVKDQTTKSNPAVTAFKIKGIPSKFVIDRDGNIRFKLTGFSGGDDAAVAEVSAMIELAKKHV